MYHSECAFNKNNPDEFDGQYLRLETVAGQKKLRKVAENVAFHVLKDYLVRTPTKEDLGQVYAYPLIPPCRNQDVIAQTVEESFSYYFGENKIGILKKIYGHYFYREEYCSSVNLDHI